MSMNKLWSAIQQAFLVSGVPAAALVLGGVASPAVAQNATTAQNNQKQPETLQTIVVTGSHIRRVDLETSNPVVAVTSQQIQATGKLTLGDVIESLPVVSGGGTNPSVNNAGGSGSTLVGLRGLGPQRTLILVDGQRVLNKDLNSIPSSAVERIEVLTDGASAVYGSDAIGGVVNIILKSNYQSAQVQFNYGISDRDDGQREGVNFTFGQTSDKGSIIAGIDYNKFDKVEQSARKFSENAVSITATTSNAPHAFVGGSTFAPRTRIQLPPALKTGAFANCRYVSLNGTGNTPATTSDPTFPGDYHCFSSATDKYNYASVNLLSTPQERTNAFFKGVYHLTGNIDAYLTVYHNKTSSGFQLAPALLGSDRGAVISQYDMYNPFGVGFDRSSTGYSYRSRLVSAGDRAADNNNTSDQIIFGLRGNVSVLNRDWTWDVGYNYGHLSTINTLLGLPNVTQLNVAMGPSALVNGVPTCLTAPLSQGGQPIAGCTPFDPFNLFTPASIATLKKIASPALIDTWAIERTEHADISGGLFDLPAGTVQLAAGTSYRKEYTNNTVDPVLLLNPITGTCTLGSQCSAHLQGGYSVKEAYAEAFIPVLKDLPFVHALDVTLGDRYSKYSSFGSTSNWKVAVEYRPINDLLLRGTVARVFRAPTIANIFQAPISSAPLLSADPCDFTAPTPTTPNPNAGNPACVGVPATGSFVNQDVKLAQQINGLQTGSAYAHFPLGPESGKSFDFGAVYSPHFVPGLSLSADVWRVFLNNVITTVGAQTILNQCFAGQQQYCPLITRNAANSTAPGQVFQIVEPTANLGRLDTRGVDFQASYKLPAFSFGQFMVNVAGTYMATYDIQTAPGTAGNAVYHGAGHYGSNGSPLGASCPFGTTGCLFPRVRGQGSLSWQLGPWDASWRMQYVGKFALGSLDLSQGTSAVGGTPNPGFPNPFVFHYGATVYNYLTVGYNIEPVNTRVDVGVDNVFDKQPPFLYANNALNANTDPIDFDLLGRFYWARVTVKF